MPPKKSRSERPSKSRKAQEKLETNKDELNLDNVVKELHQSELDQDGNKTVASIENKKIDDNNALNENLVLISRALNGVEDICTAVVISQGELFVSNNKGNAGYPKKYLNLLMKYIKSPFKENFEALNNLVRENSQFILKSKKIQDRVDKLEKEEESEIFSTLDDIQDYLKEKGKDFLSSEAQWLINEIMQPIIDTRIITNKYINNCLDQEIIKALLGAPEFIEGEKGVHAEMKLLKALEKKGKLLGSIEMGISKLCCCPCHITITLLEDKNIFIKTQGTHGGTYIGWKSPGLETVPITAIITVLEALQSKEKYTKYSESTFHYTPLEERHLLTKFDSLEHLKNEINNLKETINNEKLIEEKNNLEIKNIQTSLQAINTQINQFRSNTDKLTTIKRQLENTNKAILTIQEKLSTLLRGRTYEDLKGKGKSEYDTMRNTLKIDKQYADKLNSALHDLEYGDIEEAKNSIEGKQKEQDYLQTKLSKINTSEGLKAIHNKKQELIKLQDCYNKVKTLSSYLELPAELELQNSNNQVSIDDKDELPEVEIDGKYIPGSNTWDTPEEFMTAQALENPQESPLLISEVENPLLPIEEEISSLGSLEDNS